jgi:prepilin-type N-terminal cleavage/methylation domain-containing protein
MKTSRAGFTMVEMMVSLAVLGIVMAIALGFLSSQVRAFTSGADASVYTAGAQFALRTIEREVRSAGTNTVARQPWMVYAGPSIIAYNSDYVSNVADAFAVNVDPTAPAGEISALRATARITLPTTSVTYPDSTYWAAPGIPSPAELTIFYFAADASTPRTDDYVLYRQVNAATPVALARNILRSDTTPFFQYYRIRKQTDSLPGYSLVPSASLPMRHSQPLHLSVTDTGAVAMVDSLYGLRVTFDVTNGRTGIAARVSRRTRWIWMRNGGLAAQRSCGSAPIFNSIVTAVPTQVSGAAAVQLTWNAAVDEGGGEDDVIRYVVWRTAPGAQLADPYLSIPAGSATYTYLDGAVHSGEQWVYSVAAQDCTPSMSGLVATNPIIIP